MRAMSDVWRSKPIFTQQGAWGWLPSFYGWWMFFSGMFACWLLQGL